MQVCFTNVHIPHRDSNGLIWVTETHMNRHAQRTSTYICMQLSCYFHRYTATRTWTCPKLIFIDTDVNKLTLWKDLYEKLAGVYRGCALYPQHQESRQWGWRGTPSIQVPSRVQQPCMGTTLFSRCSVVNLICTGQTVMAETVWVLHLQHSLATSNIPCHSNTALLEHVSFYPWDDPGSNFSPNCFHLSFKNNLQEIMSVHELYVRVSQDEAGR